MCRLLSHAKYWTAKLSLGRCIRRQVSSWNYFFLALAMLCLLLIWIQVTTINTLSLYRDALSAHLLAPPPPRVKNSSRDNVYLCGVVRGKLGNAFFSYASLVGIARTNNMTLLLKDKSVLPQVLQDPPHEARDFDEKCSTALYLNQRKCCGLDKRLMHLEHNDHYMLASCLISWGYFEGIKHELRSLLAPREDHLSQARAVVKKVRTRVSAGGGENVTLVGLHVRRGDQAGFKAYFDGHYPVTSEYIKRAMAYFTCRFPRVHFLVATDDISWCRSHIRHDDVTFMEDNSSPVDLTVLTLTDHMIVSIGTYGWWAGYFNPGIKTHMKTFIRPNTDFANAFDDLNATGYIYPGWVGL